MKLNFDCPVCGATIEAERNNGIYRAWCHCSEAYGFTPDDVMATLGRECGQMYNQLMAQADRIFEKREKSN